MFLNGIYSKKITEAENSKLNAFCTVDEVKDTAFELNGDSDSGLDGFTRRFFQSCWEIMGKDIGKYFF